MAWTQLPSYCNSLQELKTLPGGERPSQHILQHTQKGRQGLPSCVNELILDLPQKRNLKF